MFAFQRPEGTPQNLNRAITQAEQASMESLSQAFGTPQQPARIPARGPSVMRPHMDTPRHIAPAGHEIQEHNIWENCPQGRKRNHSQHATTLHSNPYLSGSREVDPISTVG